MWKENTKTYQFVFCTIFKILFYNNICYLVCKVLQQKLNIILFPEESLSLHALCRYYKSYVSFFIKKQNKNKDD